MQAKPAWILRAEGLAAFAAATLVYRRSGHGWGLYALAFLAPDLGLAGYLGGEGLGAFVYNLAHTSVLPLAWVFCLWSQNVPMEGWWMPALWLAHVGLDRLLGFGLKYPVGFKTTHLQKL